MWVVSRMKLRAGSVIVVRCTLPGFEDNPSLVTTLVNVYPPFKEERSQIAVVLEGGLVGWLSVDHIEICLPTKAQKFTYYMNGGPYADG